MQAYSECSSHLLYLVGSGWWKLEDLSTHRIFKVHGWGVCVLESSQHCTNTVFQVSIILIQCFSTIDIVKSAWYTLDTVHSVFAYNNVVIFIHACCFCCRRLMTRMWPRLMRTGSTESTVTMCATKTTVWQVHAHNSTACLYFTILCILYVPN